MANPNTKFPDGLSDYLDDELRRVGERRAGPPKVPRMKTGLNKKKTVQPNENHYTYAW
jgi:hypothetical protein